MDLVAATTIFAMTSFLVRYVVGWLAFCLLALVLAVKDVRPRWKDELAFLAVPWKLALFIPAIAFVTLAGHFTNDETWDVASGGGMAVLTFVTSGWAVGTVFKVLRGERPKSHLVVALALGLFASSWYYDGYLLLRDGAYTHRWLGNLMLSPIIYAAAGLALNLEARGRGVGFAFTRADWPRPESTRSSIALAACALPLVLIAAYVLVAFVGWRLP
jgi:hypothetical protein